MKNDSIRSKTSSNNSYAIKGKAVVTAIEPAKNGAITIRLDATCFWPSNHGYTGDTGGLIGRNGAIFEVNKVLLDRQGRMCHRGRIRAGEFTVGDKVDCIADEGRRKIATWLHTAGHVVQVAAAQLRPDWNFKRVNNRPRRPYVSFYGNGTPAEIRSLKRDIEVLAGKITAVDSSLHTTIAACPRMHAEDLRLFAPVTVSSVVSQKGTITISYSIGGDPPFRNRADAGRQLAAALAEYKQCQGIVYALPRGGAVLGKIVASELNLPLELLITRKIGHPAKPEDAIGAITETGEVLWGLPPDITFPKTLLLQGVRQARAELARRQTLYRGMRGRASASGKIALVVDDGAASGLTLIAALKILLREQPQKIIIALPVINQAALPNLKKYGCVVCLRRIPSQQFTFVAVNYRRFSEVTDEDVIKLLKID